MVGNIIYEYIGDLWHGSITRYKRTDINPFNNKTMKELFDKTQSRIQTLRKAGYKVITIWESDFDKILKKQKIYEKKHNKSSNS